MASSSKKAQQAIEVVGMTHVLVKHFLLGILHSAQQALLAITTCQLPRIPDARTSALIAL